MYFSLTKKKRVTIFQFCSTPGSLKDRHIANGDVIYAIFTPKENLITVPQMPMQGVTNTDGTDTVRCHIMLKVRTCTVQHSIVVHMARDEISIEHGAN